MEAIMMRLIGAISTAVLSLIIAVPACAQQEQHDQQEEQKARPVQDEKKAQPQKSPEQNDRNGQQEDKNAQQQDKNNKQEEKNAQQQEKNYQQEIETHSNAHNRMSRHSRRSAAIPAAFPTTATEPILGRSTGFMSTRPITIIAASNMAAIRSDSLAHGRATGAIRKTFLWRR
jgi:DNA mismatch repair ATPase MutL